MTHRILSAHIWKRRTCYHYAIQMDICHSRPLFLQRNTFSRVIGQSFFSTSANDTSSSTINSSENISSSHHGQPEREKLRVSIVGGGASGLTMALHLAPLVERGIIAKPIDLYEKSSLSSFHPHEIHGEKEKKEGSIHHNDEHFHPGTGAIGRDIGVGIWSTALKPFLPSKSSDECLGEGRKSHLHLLNTLQKMGHWVGNVGYRSPNGSWLARSCLKHQHVLDSLHDPKQEDNDGATTRNDDNPALLFLREKDFLKALREAVFMEQNDYGTIKTHYAANELDASTSVEGICIPSYTTLDAQISDGASGQLLFSDGSTSSPYHFIVAADGMHSTLRSKYAGHHLSRQWKQKRRGSPEIVAKHSEKWENNDHRETNAIEDRNYTVFRGNSLLSDKEVGMDGVNFQTWGEGRSMRFAAVSMSYPAPSEKGTEKGNSSIYEYTDNQNRIESQVWFATTSDPEISKTRDAEKRKSLLLKAFANWHDPISSLIESTPANEIFMERGVAHKHTVNFVSNLGEILLYEKEVAKHNSDSGFDRSSFGAGVGQGEPGPLLLFSGDAFMTVDPVLAQGFTIGMEGAADLARTIELCINIDTNINDDIVKNDNGPLISRKKLLEELDLRQERRYGRMLCLLRATELVQALAQPHTGTISGFLSSYLIRPTMKITPKFVKRAVFMYMIKYSLGLHGTFSIADTGNIDTNKENKAEIGSTR